MRYPMHNNDTATKTCWNQDRRTTYTGGMIKVRDPPFRCRHPDTTILFVFFLVNRRSLATEERKATKDMNQHAIYFRKWGCISRCGCRTQQDWRRSPVARSFLVLVEQKYPLVVAPLKTAIHIDRQWPWRYIKGAHFLFKQSIHGHYFVQQNAKSVMRHLCQRSYNRQWRKYQQRLHEDS